MNEMMVKLLEELLMRLSSDNLTPIPNGAEYKISEGQKKFFLYVPADATTVHFETWGKQEHTLSLSKGIYPLAIRRVFADNASVVYAMWS